MIRGTVIDDIGMISCSYSLDNQVEIDITESEEPTASKTWHLKKMLNDLIWEIPIASRVYKDMIFKEEVGSINACFSSLSWT